MKEKKKRPDAVKQPDPKRMAEAKRLLNSKRVSEENQCLLLKFDKDCPGITFRNADGVITFVRWLEDRRYQIINEKEVFCFPFSKMVKLSELK